MKRLDVKKTIIYAIVPTLLGLLMVLAYFSKIPWLQSIISPSIDNITPGASREFGLLENTQNLCLLIIFMTALISVIKTRPKDQKVVWTLISLFSAWVFLEEIDYGWHFREFFLGRRPQGFINVHNIGRTDVIIKDNLTIAMGLWFVVLPLIVRKSKTALVKYVLPDLYSIFTIFLAVPVLLLAASLEEISGGGTGTLTGNISEFREFFIYYIFMLYVWEVGINRRLNKPYLGRIPDSHSESFPEISR